MKKGILYKTGKAILYTQKLNFAHHSQKEKCVKLNKEQVINPYI